MDHVLSLPIHPERVVEGHRKNEITMHRASSISYDKSYVARGSFVHFAQHSINNIFDTPGNARSLTSSGSAQSHWWYDSPTVMKLQTFLRSRMYLMVNLLCLIPALFLADVLILC